MERFFDFHGEVVSVEADADTVPSMMASSPWANERGPCRAEDCAIAFQIAERAPSPAPPKRGFFQNDDVQFIVHEKYFVLAYLRRKPWWVQIAAYDFSPDDLFHCLFTPLLFTYLMRLGRILWHCSGVVADGRSVLIPAEARGGKSTTALTLVHGGFRFLADDNVFLVLDGGRVGAASNDRELFLRKPSADRLAQLDMVANAPWTVRGEEEKKQIAMPLAENRGPHPVDLVLFPVVRLQRETVLQPLSPAEATMMCLELGLQAKNPIAIFRDRIAYEKQLELYTALATTSRCYRALLGTDAAGVTAAVRAAFQRRTTAS